MSKRTAEEAGLDAALPLKEDEDVNIDEESKEEDDGIEDAEIDDDNGLDEGEGSAEDSDASIDSVPDEEGLRAFALSWLEDKRIDGVQPPAVLDSLGLKIVCHPSSHSCHIHPPNSPFRAIPEQRVHRGEGDEGER